MPKKPSYEELGQRVKELEKAAVVQAVGGVPAKSSKCPCLDCGLLADLKFGWWEYRQLVLGWVRWKKLFGNEMN